MDMKKILSLSLLIILSCLFGAIFGFKLGANIYISKDLGPRNEDLASITTNLHTLRYLRSGELNKAIEWVEEDLDSKIMKFVFPLNGTEKEKEIAPIVLKRARLYRSEYKHNNKNPNVDSMVNEVFSKMPLD